MPSSLPILLPFLSLLAVVGSLAAREGMRRIVVWAIVTQLAQLAVAIVIFERTRAGVILVHPVGGWAEPLGISFVADRLSSFFALASSLVSSAAVVASLLDEEPNHRSRTLALIHLLQAGIFGALFTGDLFDFYVFFELLSLAAFGLVAYRGDRGHIEAGFRYTVLALTASTLMLVGIGAIYAQTGALSLSALHEASQHISSRPMYLFSLCLVFLSMSLKAAIFPLHFWLPDAHSIAPTAVSILLSGAVVKVGGYGIIRLLAAHAPWVWESVGAILLPASACTALIGALMAGAQRDLKRLLAYSTVSQMGYVVAAGSLGTKEGVRGALAYAFAHAITKASLFVVAGALIDATGQRRWDRMGGRLRGSWPLAAVGAIAAFSLAGLPPLPGFAAKLAVFGALISGGKWLALALLVASTIVILAVFFGVWLEVFRGGGSASARLPKVGLAATMGGGILLLGLASGPLLQAADDAAIQLLGGRSEATKTAAVPEKTNTLPGGVG